MAAAHAAHVHRELCRRAGDGGRVMRIVYFTHSLASCWNHGNAHFLRGVLRELLARGHEVRTLEPADGWSRQNLLRDHGAAALDGFARQLSRAARHAPTPPALDPDAAARGRRSGDGA